ncbi:DUF6412 domain-containing protein [Microbacterium sp. BWT-B31]|uniref:DUF6412 domain-containing protein n=1 Tax=Microbacterium sp. BWT-B31 TaxID=3232072 RepID=UPI0035295EED
MSSLALRLPFTGRWVARNSPANRVASHGTALFGSVWPAPRGARATATTARRQARMLDRLASPLHVLLAALGIAVTAELLSLSGASAAAFAIALVAASVIIVAALAVAHPASGGASPPHPRRAIDVSSPLEQSDPDAPGHPRPRAPQSAASAA